MYDCQDGLSWWIWPISFFMVVFGAFFIVNLALAVLFLSFTSTQKFGELHCGGRGGRNRIVCLYPHKGGSEENGKLLTTKKGGNVKKLGLRIVMYILFGGGGARKQCGLSVIGFLEFRVLRFYPKL